MSKIAYVAALHPTTRQIMVEVYRPGPCHCESNKTQTCHCFASSYADPKGKLRYCEWHSGADTRPSASAFQPYADICTRLSVWTDMLECYDTCWSSKERLAARAAEDTARTSALVASITANDAAIQMAYREYEKSCDVVNQYAQTIKKLQTQIDKIGAKPRDPQREGLVDMVAKATKHHEAMVKQGETALRHTGGTVAILSYVSDAKRDLNRARYKLSTYDHKTEVTASNNLEEQLKTMQSEHAIAVAARRNAGCRAVYVITDVIALYNTVNLAPVPSHRSVMGMMRFDVPGVADLRQCVAEYRELLRAIGTNIPTSEHATIYEAARAEQMAADAAAAEIRRQQLMATPAPQSEVPQKSWRRM